MRVLNTQDAFGTVFQRQILKFIKYKLYVTQRYQDGCNSLSKYGKEYAVPTNSPFFLTIDQFNNHFEPECYYF